MSTHPKSEGSFWQHDPEFCPSLNCPGCYAAAYKPPEHRAHYTCAAGWLPAEVCECGHYSNGDRMEDIESGKPMGDGGAGYLNDGA